MLPPFNEMGYLPPGIYEISWTEFIDRFGFNSHRQNILAGLQTALLLLAQANCQRVYIGGSFVSNKQYPNDFDGCYDDMNLDYDLLDPIFDEELTALTGERKPSAFMPWMNFDSDARFVRLFL